MDNEILTKNDLIKLLRNRYGLTYAVSKKFVDSIFLNILDSLARGETVKISSFGTFQLKFRASQEILDVITREERTVGAHYKVKFIPSKKLKEKING